MEKIAHVDDLTDGQMKEIKVGEQDILLCRIDGKYYATAAHCTHYGAPLASGVLKGRHVVCPWHHAMFDLTTGDLYQPPAFDSLLTYPLTFRDNDIYIDLPENPQGRRVPEMSKFNSTREKRLIAILGAGAAGAAASETLRQNGFEGRILLISQEQRVPYDRPNLSKEYLDGSARPEWMPLRSEEFYEDHDIELKLGKRVKRVDHTAKKLVMADDKTIGYNTLLIATGGIPRKLSVPGADLKGIYTLRSFDDADAILGNIKKGNKAVIVGASFIGMETAASLTKQGLEVTVTAPEEIPFEKVFGNRIGKLIYKTHISNDVQFQLGRSVSRFIGRDHVSKVELDNGKQLDADLVIVGIGVRPATDMIEHPQKNSDGSLNVNEYLQVDDNLFAAGDVARFPDIRSGGPIRIEHWRLAQQHGRIAAHNMLNQSVPFRSIPFFWTHQFDLGLMYTGFAPGWDSIQIDGDIEGKDFMAYYIRNNKVLAALTPNRDRELAAVQELMQRDKMPAVQNLGKENKTMQEMLAEA